MSHQILAESRVANIEYSPHVGQEYVENDLQLNMIASIAENHSDDSHHPEPASPQLSPGRLTTPNNEQASAPSDPIDVVQILIVLICL